MDTVEQRFRIPQKLDRVLQLAIEEGLFINKTDVMKAALIEYLDKMHLLDQIKNSIESKPSD